MNDHLRATQTDRGFTHMPPLNALRGEEVRAYESSNAEEPCVWLSLGGSTEQLPVQVAWQLADQLRDLVVGHYQGGFFAEEWIEAGEIERVRQRMKAVQEGGS